MFPRRTQSASMLYLAISVACLLVASFFFLSAPTPITHAQSQPEALGSLSGTVTNANGEPLAGITVTLEIYQKDFPQSPQIVRTTTTNNSGDYNISALYPGTYALKFTDGLGTYATIYYPNGATLAEATPVMVSGNSVAVDMQMPNGGTIAVTIQHVETYTTSNFSGQLYRKEPAGRWQLYRTTDFFISQSNAITFTALPFGTYRFCGTLISTSYSLNRLCHDNIKSAYDNPLPVSNATDIVIDNVETRQINMDFFADSQIQGRVLSPSGEPLVGVILLANPLYGPQLAEAVTNEQGYFRFPTLYPGDYHILVNGYNWGSYTIYNNLLPHYYPNTPNFSEAQVIEVKPDTRMNVTFNLVEGGKITGTVKLVDDVPLANPYFTLYVLNTNKTEWITCYNAFSNCADQSYDPTTGAYTITRVIPNSYRLGVVQAIPTTNQLMGGFHGGGSHPNEAKTFTVASGQTTSNIDIVLGETGFDGGITGTVTADGVGQAGIVVGVHNSSFGSYTDAPFLTTTTDAQGNYRIENLPTGYYRISVRDPQGRYIYSFHESATSYPPLFVSGLKVTPDINFALLPAGTIKGQIRTPFYEPPSGYRIRVYEVYPEGYDRPITHVGTISGKDGHYEISGLAPKTYYISAQPPEGSYFPYYFEFFYPRGYDRSTALTVTVQAGQVTPDIDISFGESNTARLPYITTETSTRR